MDPATKPLLPEARQPGMKAMVAIGSLLVAEHACTVLMCRCPPEHGAGRLGHRGRDRGRVVGRGRAGVHPRGRMFVLPDDAARAMAGGAGRGRAIDPSGLARAMRRRWTSTPGEGALKTEKGAIKSVRENIVLALDGHGRQGLAGWREAGVIAWNEFTNDVESSGRRHGARRQGVARGG